MSFYPTQADVITQHAQLMCLCFCQPPPSSLLPCRLSNETHATAQRKQEQMEKLRQAFGLKDVSTQLP